MANETICINGVTYKVTAAITRDDATPYQRKLMRRQGKTRFLFMRRVNGRAVYHVAEYRGAQGGRLYGEVVSMGVSL